MSQKNLNPSAKLKTDWIQRVIHHQLFMPIVGLLIVLLSNLITKPDFFSISIKNGVLYGNLIDVLNRGSELVILAIGMTLVTAASGGQDISVGAVMSVSAAVCCSLLSAGAASTSVLNMPIIVAALAGILAAGLCGAFNGLLVAKFRIQPMVATLILFTAGRGIAQLFTSGQNVYVRVDSFKVFGNFIPGFPIPTPIIISIITVAVVAIVLKKTTLGLYVQSVGINSNASRLVGLNAVRIKFIVYVICGLLAGLAGFISSSRIYSADSNNIGLYLEMDAILAVALGGNLLSGGKFSLAGSVIGAFTIQGLTTTLYAMNVSADQLPVYKAIVVIFIVVFQSPEFQNKISRFKQTRKSNTKAVKEGTLA